jgi:hypothetical protein
MIFVFPLFNGMICGFVEGANTNLLHYLFFIIVGNIQIGVIKPLLPTYWV